VTPTCRGPPGVLPRAIRASLEILRPESKGVRDTEKEDHHRNPHHIITHNHPPQIRYPLLRFPPGIQTPSQMARAKGLPAGRRGR